MSHPRPDLRACHAFHLPYSLEEDPCSDCCVHLWCSPCAVCQEVRPWCSADHPVESSKAFASLACTWNAVRATIAHASQLIVAWAPKLVNNGHIPAYFQPMRDMRLLDHTHWHEWHLTPVVLLSPCRPVSTRHKLPRAPPTRPWRPLVHRRWCKDIMPFLNKAVSSIGLSAPTVLAVSTRLGKSLLAVDASFIMIV
jgi:hypothetical protein